MHATDSEDNQKEQETIKNNSGRSETNFFAAQTNTIFFAAKQSEKKLRGGPREKLKRTKRRELAKATQPLENQGTPTLTSRTRGLHQYG